MDEYKHVKTGRLLRGGAMPLVKYDPTGEYATPQNNWEDALLPAQPYPQRTVLVFEFQGVNAAIEWASEVDSLIPGSNLESTLRNTITEDGDDILDVLNTVLKKAKREKVLSLDKPLHFELVRERGSDNSRSFSQVLKWAHTLLFDAERALPSFVKLPEKVRISGLFIASVYTPRNSASAPLRQDMPGTRPPAKPAKPAEPAEAAGPGKSKLYDWTIWTQDAGGKKTDAWGFDMDKVEWGPLEKYPEGTLLYNGQPPFKREKIAKGSYGTIFLNSFGSAKNPFPLNLAEKIIELGSLSTERVNETLNAIQTAKRLMACDLVYFKVWINKVKPGTKTNQRVTNVDILAPKRLIISMEPLKGDGTDFLKNQFPASLLSVGLSKLQRTDLEQATISLVNFLAKLKECLFSKPVPSTFPDMKLKNLGYTFDKAETLHWRLLDLDGINSSDFTFPYSKERPLRKDKQTVYAIGITIAQFIWPWVMGTVTLPRTFYHSLLDPQQNKRELNSLIQRLNFSRDEESREFTTACIYMLNRSMNLAGKTFN
tara:strand:+ start:241 stop:1863 length:1623 start_codon:yes stop_codon:yes gene_type:complete